MVIFMLSKNLLDKMKAGTWLPVKERFQLVFFLSIPAIMAQVTSVIMQYTDASMAGSLGADASASIGLVSSSTWLFGGVCGAVASGFSIQAAQSIGGGRIKEARSIMRQSVVTAITASIILVITGILAGINLPAWLGGAKEIQSNARIYFIIYVLSLPAIQLNRLAGGLLQCSGNMKVPGILNILMCILDVIFNFLLIFKTRNIYIYGIKIIIPGAGLGVAGAALGTAFSQVLVAMLMMGFLCFKSDVFKVKHGESWKPGREYVLRAIKLALPIGLENFMMCSAMVVSTRIVAPLGSVSIAANSFAITAESLCYMPGYGIAEAAAAITGQCIGAGRKKLAEKFAKMTVWFGIASMSVTGAAMFFAAPAMMALLTPDPSIRQLGTAVLHIEAFAEPMYGASIVAAGSFRGAGDTLIPSIMNFCSIWFVRITLAVILTGRFGLKGAWVAMCIELCFRGIIFMVRLYSGKWITKTDALS